MIRLITTLIAYRAARGSRRRWGRRWTFEYCWEHSERYDSTMDWVGLAAVLFTVLYFGWHLIRWWLR